MDATPSFDQFRQRLAAALDLPADQLGAGTRFREDLALDSIGMMELAVALDDLDVQVPDDAAWDVATVGEAYDLLLAAAGSRRTPG